MTDARQIVVGVDDSSGARAALRWALEETARRGTPLVVLHVYSLDVAWIDDGADRKRWSAAARRAADVTLADIFDDVPPPSGVEVEPRVVEGDPVTALVEASADTELLVVGSRGRGGLTGLLLGSVSQRCVERAHCPVVVVPGGAGSTHPPS